MGDGAVGIDPNDGRFTLKTPRTCGGFAENGLLEADALSADLGGTAATLWASSLDALPIRESAHILVTHLTDVQNSNVTYADSQLRILIGWGGLPHLMRVGKAKVSLVASAGQWTVHVLGTNGARRRVAPSTYADGRLSFVADVAADRENASYLYELVRE